MKYTISLLVPLMAWFMLAVTVLFPLTERMAQIMAVR